VPVHLQPAYQDLGYISGDLPISERVAEQVLSLPLYPEMDPDSLNITGQAIIEFCQLG
jgi:dTDP-4-amino-4,6-dideoxygalactose transaminase